MHGAFEMWKVSRLARFLLPPGRGRQGCATDRPAGRPTRRAAGRRVEAAAPPARPRPRVTVPAAISVSSIVRGWTSRRTVWASASKLGAGPERASGSGWPPSTTPPRSATARPAGRGGWGGGPSHPRRAAGRRRGAASRSGQTPGCRSPGRQPGRGPPGRNAASSVPPGRGRAGPGRREAGRWGRRGRRKPASCVICTFPLTGPVERNMCNLHISRWSPAMRFSPSSPGLRLGPRPGGGLRAGWR